MAVAHPPAKTRPGILLVLQGEHHLDLFHAILTQCPAFDWTCLVHGMAAIPRPRLEALHDSHGVRFFTDLQTALLHFGDLDAVVTTFALPHRAHLPYLGLIALAQEMGLPVFELQHGLFQSGLSFHADGAIAGSGLAGARDGVPVRNLADAVLPWWGAGAIGYPGLHPAWRGILADPPDDADSLAKAVNDVRIDPVVAESDPPWVAVLTNLHWTILSPAESQQGYALLRAAILALPDLHFVLAPHPTEATSAGFARLRADLERAGARNVAVCPPSDRPGRTRLLRQARLALATPSTVLLDLEMRGIPTLLLGLPPFEGLYAALDRACVIRDAPALVAAIADGVGGAGPTPVLRTGRLLPFDAAALTARLHAALPDPGAPPRPPRDYVPLIHRHATLAGRP